MNTAALAPSLSVGVQAVPVSTASDDSRPLVVDSSELLKGRRELWIEHHGELYRLRLTSAGKLYMTK